jgi:hypothetical protein
MPTKQKSFFHPVLSQFSTDYKPGVIFNVELTPSVIEEGSRDQISIEYSIDLTSSSLRDFVIDKRAVFAFDVYCGETMFRTLHKTYELGGEFILPPASVKGNLEIQTSVTVIDNSSPFELEEINDEYPSNVFDIDLGVPLALAPSISIPIEFALVTSKEMVRVQLERKRNPNSYFVNAQPDQIVVHMGSNAHATFHALSGDPGKKPTLFYSIYKDCVAHVLSLLIQDQRESEYLWEENFKEQLENRNIRLPQKDAAFNDINQLALEILGPKGFAKVTPNDN